MTEPPPITRRDLLKGGALLPVTAAWPATPRPSPRPARRRGAPPTVRNVVFLVSDGMSAGVPSLAEPFSQMVRGRGTCWHRLAAADDTVRGYLETASLDSMVTDSAAAASAWGSGSRVANGAVNVLPGGRPLRPIADIARAAGRAVGLVTTTTITHATPAGFAAVQPKREDQAAIATQYAGVVDVALGGGEEYFRAADRKDARDLLAEFAASGGAVCSTRDEMAAAGGGRLLGVFGRGHLPYTIDQVNRPADHPRVPTLRAMTRVALERLAAMGDGFLLQVEGGRVDHAAHNNDAAAMLWDQIAFDDAAEEVLAFRADHPDTLVVLTTDHGNANPGLNGIGTGYRDSTASFRRLATITASFPVIHAALGEDGGDVAPRPTGDVIEIVRRHTGLTVPEPAAEAIARARAKQTVPDLNPQHRGFEGALGQAIGIDTGIQWTGTSHTSDLALLLAVGPGSERFAGVMHHTKVFGVLCGLMGVAHENPRAETT